MIPSINIFNENEVEFTIEYIRKRFEYRKITRNLLEEIDDLYREIEYNIESTMEDTKEKRDCLELLCIIRREVDCKLG